MVGNGSFKEKLIHLFEDNEQLLTRHDTRKIAGIRYSSFDQFKNQSFPGSRSEDWKNTDLSSALGKDYYQYLQAPEEDVDIDSLFRCEVHNFETDQISFHNGWFVPSSKKTTDLPEGVIIGSLADAFKSHPGLIEEHFGKYADPSKSIFQAMNTAFAQDGMFVYVPDNVVIDKPIQMISIISHPDNLLVQNRNLIILGKSSKMTLVQCDDSTNHKSSFNNSVTEIYMDDNSELIHYKLQNLNDSSTLLNSSYFHQESHSRLHSFAITLNGGLIRNYSQARLNGKGSSANVYGLYLMDKKQHVHNRVFIEHAAPDCHSNELFKGILDDEASAVFNGHILVMRDAQKTNAYQNNKNILLTDKARAHAKPFLEIYADDVKCSHGATVGQLDAEALFYIRSRGICQASARLLLMYAFAAEVINKISIESLQKRIDDMVKQRLRGELSICDRCVLHCSNQEKEISFDIDLSKV